MAKVGNWGKELRFYVDSERQFPFRDFNRKVGARWATHEIVQGNTRAEYLGIEQSTISLEVTFSAERGQRPYRDIKALNKACKAGDINYLYVGGKRIGNCKWYIDSITEDWKEVWNKGELVKATCKITFKEYH
jgi:phage protein U